VCLAADDQTYNGHRHCASNHPTADTIVAGLRNVVRIVSDAIRDNSDELTADIAHNVSDHVNKELDFLFREKEEADEQRFRQLDETIRSFQKARQEAAAAEIVEKRKKRKRMRR